MMTSNLALYADHYGAAKQTLGQALQLSDDLLHVHVGLAIFVTTAVLLRRRMRSLWPLGMVGAFTLGNEIVDYLGSDPWSATRSAMDAANTMVWPLLLFVLARQASTRPTQT